MKVVAPQFIFSPTPRGRMHNQCLAETRMISNNVMNVANDLFLTDLEWKTYCTGLDDRTHVVCDLEPLMKDRTNNELCSQAGGSIIPIDFSMCNAQMVIGDFVNGKPIHIQHLEFQNFPQCAGLTCNDVDLLDIIQGDISTRDIQCQEEKKYRKFGLRVRGRHEIVRRSCNWLSMKSDTFKRKVCQARKYQLYAKSSLPASRICPETCKPYHCVEEKRNSIFMITAPLVVPRAVDATTRMNPYLGSGISGVDNNLHLNTCAWLAAQPKNILVQVCGQDASPDSEYGPAKEVCTWTCKTSC